WRFAMPTLWLVFPPLFLITYSLVSNVWVERYAIPSLGGLIVLVAYGLSRVRGRAALAAVLVLTVAAAGYGVVRWYTNPGLASFNDLLQGIEQQVRPGDALVVATDRSRVPLEFALRHSRLRSTLTPAFPDTAWGRFHTGMQTGRVLPARTANALPE